MSFWQLTFLCRDQVLPELLADSALKPAAAAAAALPSCAVVEQPVELAHPRPLPLVSPMDMDLTSRCCISQDIPVAARFAR